MYHLVLKIECDSSEPQQHNLLQKYGLTEDSKQ